MGGIISRYFVQKLGGAERVTTLCTLAAPHQGTLFGFCWPSLGAKQMRPGSEFLKSLAESEDVLDGVAVHTWWTPLDLMILPPTNATWPGRKSNRVVVVAHPLMVFDGDFVFIAGEVSAFGVLRAAAVGAVPVVESQQLGGVAVGTIPEHLVRTQIASFCHRW